MAKPNKRIDINRILNKYNFKGSKQLQNAAFRAAKKIATQVKK